MRVLCVAEKPSIAKSITAILSGGQFNTRNSAHRFIKNYDFHYELPPPLGPARGGAQFTVTSVLGHLTSSDFDEQYKKWSSCDPFALFDAPIVTFVSKDLFPVQSNLRQEARSADLLLIWTDCDREGEHIGSEVRDACRLGNRGIMVKRARFSAIIPAQIKRACHAPFELDMRQAEAVNARMALDLRIGAAFTRLQTMVLQRDVPGLREAVLSYGPCQFPTLGFVVDQYERVQSFIPEQFWYIYISQSRAASGGEGEVVFNWKRNHLFDFPAALVLYEQCVERPLARVVGVAVKPTQKWKPLPLTTVDLQKSGSRLLGFTPKKVLDIAEKLYQMGFLSYPRTETDQFDRDFDFDPLIRKQVVDDAWGLFAQSLLDGGFERPRNGQKNDKAHPPIHPTAHANNLNQEEKAVYEFVTRRFLACCSKNGEGKTTTVEIEVAGERFHTSGLVISARNYLEVYRYDKWSDSVVPDFDVGETFTPDVCELRDGQTTAPKLLTEADLVGLMDKNGIGTDATIAEHIAKIIDRDYVEEQREGRIKYLFPSKLGIALVEGYNQIGFERSLSKPHLRRETEHRMQLICDGIQSKNDVLQESIQEYQDVFVRARREFGTMTATVNRYLNEQPNRPPAAARAPRRNNRRPPADDVDSNPSEDDDNDGGGAPRGGARGRGRGAAARGATARGTGRGAAARVPAAPRGRPANNRRDDADDNADGNELPQCACGEAAVERTVTKQTANQGKKFFACSKGEGGCGHFEWAEAGGAGPSANPGPKKRGPPANSRVERPAKRGRQDNGGGNEAKQCNCNVEAPLRTVAKEGPNQGRQFFSCSKPQDDRCGFFEWADEPGDTGQQNQQQRPAPARGVATQNTDACFKCGEEGHWSSACPNDGNQGRGNGNQQQYGQRGARDDGPQSGARGSGGNQCFKCNEEGHWSNACPNEQGSTSRNNRSANGRGAQSRQNAGAQGVAQDTCFKCGESGHWSNACPNDYPQQGQSNGGRNAMAGRGGGSRGGRR